MIGDNLNEDILGNKKCGLKTLYKFEYKNKSKFDDIIPNGSFNEYINFLTLIKKIQV